MTEITSSINSRVRLWKINYSGPGRKPDNEASTFVATLMALESQCRRGTIILIARGVCIHFGLVYEG